MMRVIPKRTNVRMELFRGVEVIDVIVGAVGALIAISFAVSNLPAKFIFAVIMVVLTIALVIPLGDEKGYMVVLYGLRFLGQPRYFEKRKKLQEKVTKKQQEQLSVEDITPFTGIDGKYIKYGEKYSAVVMSIPSVEFRFFTLIMKTIEQ